MRQESKDALAGLLKRSDPIEIAYAAICAAVTMPDWKPRSLTKSQLALLAGMAIGLHEKHKIRPEIIPIMVRDDNDTPASR